MLKKNVFGLCLMIITCSAAHAFDLEDYATTYRATRDAYQKAANEMQLATGPYKAARDAYRGATKEYTNSLGNGKDSLDESMLSTKKRLCIFSADLNDRSGDKVKFEPSSLPGHILPEVNKDQIISNEQSARNEYYYALREVEAAGKAKAGAVQVYKKATQEYVNTLSTPMDLVLIQRTEIINNNK